MKDWKLSATARRGSESIEAAIAVPLLLLVIFAACEYGWLVLKSTQIDGVARLGARSLVLQGSGSSTSKGETFLDTALNVEALGVDAIVVRSALSGGPELLSHHVGCAVINAGDGRHEHPTQGLLDCLTIRRARNSLVSKEIR